MMTLLKTTAGSDKTSQQPTKLQLDDINEFEQLLNRFNLNWQEEMKHTLPNPTEQEQKMVKELFVNLTKTLASTLCLPNDEPISLEAVLTEPDDDGLVKEREKRKLETRQVQQRVVLTRQTFVDHITPLIDEAVKAESNYYAQGTFEEETATDTNDTPIDPSVSQKVQKEFKESLALLSKVQKELPECLDTYDHIDKVLKNMKDD